MHSPSHAEQRELEAPCKLYNVEHPTTKVMYNWSNTVGLNTGIKNRPLPVALNHSCVASVAILPL